MSDKAVNSVIIKVDPIDICQDDNHAGPAFPTDRHEGMTLLDYFAAKAMAAMIGTSSEPWSSGCENYVATNAYAMAEAMLAEREKRNG